MKQRPTLTQENVPEYLDWALTNQRHMTMGEIEHHLTACELVVRLKMGEAQGKDTQHTLVRDGIIDPPPPAQAG